MTKNYQSEIFLKEMDEILSNEKLSQIFEVIKFRYNEKFSTRFFQREIVMTKKNILIKLGMSKNNSKRFLFLIKIYCCLK